jgi:uncharacterized UBP type Zn finger protein
VSDGAADGTSEGESGVKGEAGELLSGSGGGLSSGHYVGWIVKRPKNKKTVVKNSGRTR